MKFRRFARVLSAVMIAATMAMVFWLSGEDGGASSARSAAVADLLARVAVPGYAQMSAAERAAVVGRMQLPLRKAGHAAEYALLGCWLCVFARSVGARGWRGGLRAFLGATAFAATDELHQLFSAGRGPSARDVGIDALGALLGVLVAMWILRAASRWLRSRPETQK